MLFAPLLAHVHEDATPGIWNAPLPVNPKLGVPGFPDCVRVHPNRSLSVEDAAEDLICKQKEAPADAITIGCIGDSITAGAHSSGGNHTYPSQMQVALDAKYGSGEYSVTVRCPSFACPIRLASLESRLPVRRTSARAARRC
jgi:hypothetical protein